jgi:hypothetical protein
MKTVKFLAKTTHVKIKYFYSQKCNLKNPFVIENEAITGYQ